jgi:hypothetical protein
LHWNQHPPLIVAAAVIFAIALWLLLPVHTYGGIQSEEEKGRKVYFYLRHNKLKKTNLDQVFSKSRSGTIAHKKKKIWQSPNLDRLAKRGRVHNLDSLKKELWNKNLAKKSTNTQKIELRQAPSYKNNNIIICSSNYL